MILNPTSSNFRAFGKIIAYPNQGSKGKKRNLWKIIHTQPRAAGWRVAYLVLRDKSLGRLECHPESDETFEPVKGRSIIFVSKDKSLKKIRCFYLDKPVVVYKGIWHGLISLDAQTEIKVTENAKVKCLYWPLGFRIKSMQELAKRFDKMPRKREK